MAFDAFAQNINPLKQLWGQEDKEANQSNDCQPTSFEKFVFYCGEALSHRRFKIIKGYKAWKKYENFSPWRGLSFFTKMSLTLDRII